MLIQLRAQPRLQLESEVLQARRALAHSDYVQALHLLDDVCQRNPQAIWPRVIRSHAILQEDRDPRAAEQALREILTLDPDNLQAKHNLQLLLQRHAP